MSQHRTLLFALALMLSWAIGGWARHAAVGAGFWADDYAQLAMLEGTYPSDRAAWDLFHFIDDRRDDHQRMVDFGANHWWTHPHFRFSMLRPLSSLSAALDHALYRFDARPQHIHSLLWWGLLVTVVAINLFQLLPPLTAAIAVLLFSVDESHTVPVLWLANRSALMATVFALAALAAHVRWRNHLERSSWRYLSIGLYTLALCCGEYAFASLGYILCVELLRPVPGIARRRALLPFIVLALLFLLVSTALGYGTAHSALYTSPFSAPLDYASKVLTGFPVLLAELVLGIPADWWSFGSPWPEELRSALSVDPATWARLPSWKTCQLVLGGTSALITIGTLRWLRRHLSEQHHAALVWLVAGACLGILPSLGSFITTRLALPASFAFSAVFGAVIALAITSLGRSATGVRMQMGSRIGLALFAGILVYIHGYRALSLSEASTNFYAFVAQSRSRWPLTAAMDASKESGQRLVMIASADANDAAYMPFVRTAFGRPLLRGFRLLSGAPGGHAITRVDHQTLDVRVIDDFGLSTSVADSFTRGPSEGMSPGEQVHIAGMDVTVLQTHQGQPTHMRFRFDEPLESEHLVFVSSTPRGLEPLSLPTVGNTLQLPPPTMPNLSLLAAP